jgi:hypothetical protein
MTTTTRIIPLNRLWSYGWTDERIAVLDPAAGTVWGLGADEASARADALDHCPDLDLDLCEVVEIQVSEPPLGDLLAAVVPGTARATDVVALLRGDDDLVACLRPASREYGAIWRATDAPEMPRLFLSREARDSLAADIEASEDD